MEGQGDRENFSNLQAEGQPPISFANQGIPPIPKIHDTPAGPARSCRALFRCEIAYVSFMVASIVATIVITACRIAKVGTHSPDFAFSLVLIVNAGFCLWYVFEGVWRERPTEIVILIVAKIFILIYIITNYAAGRHTDLKQIRLVISFIAVLLLCIPGGHYARKYHKEKHIIFRSVGANGYLQKLFSRLLTFQDFLKFDLQLGVSMVILIDAPKSSFDIEDIIVFVVGGVFTLAWFLLGFFSMKKEWKYGARTFFAASLVEIGYIFYKFYHVSTYLDAFPGVGGATIACCVVALLLRGLVIFLGIIVSKNFGSGLKEILNSPGKENKPLTTCSTFNNSTFDNNETSTYGSSTCLL